MKCWRCATLICAFSSKLRPPPLPLILEALVCHPPKICFFVSRITLHGACTLRKLREQFSLQNYFMRAFSTRTMISKVNVPLCTCTVHYGDATLLLTASTVLSSFLVWCLWRCLHHSRVLPEVDIFWSWWRQNIIAATIQFLRVFVQGRVTYTCISIFREIFEQVLFSYNSNNQQSNENNTC